VSPWWFILSLFYRRPPAGYSASTLLLPPFSPLSHIASCSVCFPISAIAPMEGRWPFSFHLLRTSVLLSGLPRHGRTSSSFSYRSPLRSVFSFLPHFFFFIYYLYPAGTRTTSSVRSPAPFAFPDVLAERTAPRAFSRR